jgi:hypothetical protein
LIFFFSPEVAHKEFLDRLELINPSAQRPLQKIGLNSLHPRVTVSGQEDLSTHGLERRLLARSFHP